MITNNVILAHKLFKFLTKKKKEINGALDSQVRYEKNPTIELTRISSR